MKGKQLAVLLVLVVVLGTAGYLLQKRNQSSWTESARGPGGKVIEFPINDVTRLLVKSSGAEVNVLRKDDDWAVQERGDYPANFEQVSGLLRKLWDLKPGQHVKVGASQLSRLELVEPGKGDPSGTLIELKGKEGTILGGLLLGKTYVRKSEGGPAEMPGMPGLPAGRYVMPVGATNKVSLVSETFEEIDAKPERWLRRDFIKVENPKSIALVGQTETMRWILTRDTATAEWKLVDAKPEEKLDTAKVGSFATLFASPSFKDVLALDAKPTGLDKPSTVTIETFDNFIYTLKIGELTAETYPVLITVSANLAKERTAGKDEKPEDKTRLDEEFKTTAKRLEDKLTAEKKFEQRPYLLEKFTVEPLLKERAALLAEQKPENAPASATTPPVSVTPPPVSVTTPPVSVTTPPVSVTTPPVSVTTPPVAAPPPAKAPGTTPPAAAPVTAPKGAATPAPRATPKPPAAGRNEKKAR